MKININDIDSEEFLVKPVIFGGRGSFLVGPKSIKTKWKPETLIFRSSIWSEDGELLSAGKKKFHNAHECPEIDPLPASLRGARVLEKLDGSLGIFDFVNGVFSSRTRGTANSNQLENSADFEEIKGRYDIEGYLRRNPHLSLLCEITSPRQRIVIDYGDTPEAYLIGLVDKRDYSYLSQDEVAKVAAQLGMPRPRTYQFDSIESILAQLQELKGIEGYCLYYGNDQKIRKLKGNWYTCIHRLKSELSNTEKVLDLFLKEGSPSYEDFYKRISDFFDFEIAEQVRGTISKICDANKEALRIISYMQHFIEARLNGLTRAQQAKIVLDSYGATGRSGMCFKLLDGKTLDKEDYKKLILQIMKK